MKGRGMKVESRMIAMKWMALGMALVCGLLAGCGSLAWKKPRVELDHIELAGGNLFEQKLQLTLRVHNPNAYAIDLDGLTFSVFVGESRVASGSLPAPVSIPAAADRNVDLDGRANLLMLLRRLPDGAIKDGKLGYKVRGEAQVRNYGTVPFEHDGGLDLGRLLGPGRSE